MSTLRVYGTSLLQALLIQSPQARQPVCMAEVKDNYGNGASPAGGNPAASPPSEGVTPVINAYIYYCNHGFGNFVRFTATKAGAYQLTAATSKMARFDATNSDLCAERREC